MNYDKSNGDVWFRESDHVYGNFKQPEVKYTSVTTLIGRYEQEFDSDFVSKYKAVERLIPAAVWKKEKGALWKNHKIPKEFLEANEIDEKELNRVQQEILDEWAQINKTSCERGTKIHAQLENSFYKTGKDINLQKFGIGGKFQCKKDYTELDLEYGVYPEYLIYYDNPKIDLHIAGQIDLIVKNGNDIWIIDHKGLPLDTPIATEDGWKTMEELQVGDRVFDKDGKLCNVTVKSEVHHNPCFKINFDNTDSIICDYEHRWLISFKKGNKYKEIVMTTEEIAAYIEKTKSEGKWRSNNIPRILNAKPIELPRLNLPIDPYVLGCWLGDGSAAAGCITNQTNNIWGEIKNRGYKIGDNIGGKEYCEMRTILGLYPLLKSLNLINNKHIPNMYLRASYNQRLDLLRGLMDTDGYYNPIRKRFVMTTDHQWQMEGMVQLCSSLGIKVSVFDAHPKCNGKIYKGWNVTFSTLGLNPFLSRNQENIEYPSVNKCTFRNIISVEEVETVPTQCIAVDSPSHTYLAGYSMIVTHNSNKKIDMKGFYDSSIRSEKKMKYPLTSLGDCNYNHYQLQLSTYAWMLQKINPDFVIKDLILNHYDHDGKNTLYHCTYLKDEVEKMLIHFAKQLKLENQRKKYERI